eukprot:TRINITY_DN7127_c0_g1_i1.p1 TRINITY_DN7127_c0_g1~~TRINITY_DN7127_c0_g1_i1.p1  ORF type:complete len:822 (+),score=183.89 TRINITY_DN7127_c0_g1_i1:180-2468(+)
MGVWVVTGFGTASYVMKTLLVTPCVHAVSLLAFMLSVCMRDLHFAASPEGHRAWPMMILAVIWAVYTRAPRQLTIALEALGCVWLVVLEIELAYRFGLLDVPGLPKYDARGRACACAEPPCAPETPVTNAFVNSLCVVSAFLVTGLLLRAAVKQPDGEKETVLRAVRTAEEVTACLASLDLDAAEARLDAHARELPASVHAPLFRVLTYLRAYKPWILSCALEQSDCENSEGDFPGPRPSDLPGVKTARAAVAAVALPRRQMDALWHVSSTAMQVALGAFSRVIRGAGGAHGGYVARAFGDMFVLAFHEVSDAVAFGMDLHADFMDDGMWPIEMVERRGADHGAGIVNAQVGVDVGGVVVAPCTLTGRLNYSGAAMAGASRAGEMGVPGTVTITGAALGELPQSGLHIVPNARAAHEGYPLWVVVPAGATAELELLVAEQCGKADPWGRHRQSQPSGSLGSSFSFTISDPSTIDPPPMRSLSRKGVRAAGAVGVVKYASWADVEDAALLTATEATCTSRLAALHKCVAATCGHVSMVLNDLAVVSWGLHGLCPQYLNESVRFVLLLADAWGDGGGVGAPFHAGLTSGWVASGALASAPNQLHVTPVGPCVGLAVMLCNGAAETDAAVLLASRARGEDAYDRSDSLRRLLWAVDTWDEPSKMTVYELDMDAAAAAAAVEGVKMGREVAPPSGRAAAFSDYHRAYACSDADGVAAHAAVFASAPAVAARLRNATHLSSGLAAADERDTAYKSGQALFSSSPRST